MSCSAPNLTATHQFTAFCILNSLHIEKNVSWKKIATWKNKKNISAFIQRAAARQTTGQRRDLILTLPSCQKEREVRGHNMEPEITTKLIVS